ARVRAELIAPCPPTDGAALYLIETDSISRIGSSMGTSSERASAAGMEVISVPGSTRKVSARQPPLLSLMRRSSSARSRMSPVFQTGLPRSGTSSRDITSRLPDLDFQPLLLAHATEELANLFRPHGQHLRPLRRRT